LHMLIVFRDQVRNGCAWLSQLRSITLHSKVQTDQNVWPEFSAIFPLT
jgi:hypothetical protein